jgi:outer membrane receptor for ferrienterochelin and colicin
MSNPLNQLSPRLSVSYKLTEKLDLNSNFGRYAMQPAYTTLGYKYTTGGEYVNKNEKLKSIISNQAIVGFDYRPAEKLRFTLEGFYKQYMNYPLSVTDGLSIASKGTDYGQVGDEEIISTGKGRAYGVEFLAKLIEWKQLNTSLTYTYFRSEFTDKNEVYRPSSWDTRHMLNLISSYKFSGSWNVAARWRFIGGAPYSPIDMTLSENKDAWSVTNQAIVDYENFNSLRLKNSHQLDIRIDKEFYFKKWVLNLYTDIQNAYNFKSQSPPIYTNRDVEGNILMHSSNNEDLQGLRMIETYNGTILPTIGIIIKI